VEEVDFFKLVFLKRVTGAGLYTEGLSEVGEVMQFGATEVGANGCMNAICNQRGVYMFPTIELGW